MHDQGEGACLTSTRTKQVVESMAKQMNMFEICRMVIRLSQNVGKVKVSHAEQSGPEFLKMYCTHVTTS